MPTRRRHGRRASPRYVLDLLSFVRNPKARPRNPVHRSLVSHPHDPSFTCVTSCICLTAAAATVVSGHNSKSLRCANRVYRRSRWNVRPRVSTIIKPRPRLQSPHVRRDIHTWPLLSPVRQVVTIIAKPFDRNAWTRRSEISPQRQIRNRDKFAAVINGAARNKPLVKRSSLDT